MATNLKNALDLISTTLDGNATINAWCLTNFHKIPTIFIGISPTNPPKFEGNCPLIIVGPGTRYREQNQAHRTHTIKVGCAIESNAQTKSTSEQVTRFTGVDLLDEFANLVENAITKAMNKNGYPSMQEPEIEDEITADATIFVFKAIWSYTLRCPALVT